MKLIERTRRHPGRVFVSREQNELRTLGVHQPLMRENAHCEMVISLTGDDESISVTPEMCGVLEIVTVKPIGLPEQIPCQNFKSSEMRIARIGDTQATVTR
jgi:hypothetical protein